MTRIDDRLRKVEIELAEIKGRIGQIPTTWQMITFMVTSQIAFAGVLVATLRFAGHS